MDVIIEGGLMRGLGRGIILGGVLKDPLGGAGGSVGWVPERVVLCDGRESTKGLFAGISSLWRGFAVVLEAIQYKEEQQRKSKGYHNIKIHKSTRLNREVKQGIIVSLARIRVGAVLTPRRVTDEV